MCERDGAVPEQAASPGGTNASAPATPATPPTSGGATKLQAPSNKWWTVTSARPGDQVRALRLVADEIAFIGTANQLKLLPAHLDRADGREWVWSSGGYTCVLAKDGEAATIACTKAGHREMFSLAPAADAVALEAIWTKGRPSPDACPRAEACFAVAYEIIAPGKQPDLDSELGNPRAPQMCESTFANMKELFGQLQKPLPKECQPTR